MAAFRLLNSFPVYLDHEGRPASGGWLAFYESGTTTPKDVYGNPGLSTNNGATVGLDSDGRTTHDVWGDGAYRVRLYDADGTPLAEADNVEVGGGDAQSIPALQTGQFLTNNGAVLQWAPVRELPDPTGQDGKMLVADGASAIWQPIPEAVEPPEPDITVDQVSRSFLAGVSGDSAKLCILSGTGTAPASGNWITSADIEFSPGFSQLWNVIITVTSARVSTADSGYLPASSVTGWTPGNASSGATVNFVLCEDDRGPANKFTSAVPFAWTAIGVRTVADVPVTPA